MPSGRRRRPALPAGGAPRSARREVFLNLRAPFGPLSCCLLGHVVRQRLRALGVTLPHYGPHALRHSCATHLLEQGLSLKEIGDHLGHQDPETTRLYAKVDLAGTASRRGFRSGGLAMNIDELVTHYVAFRRTLGEKFKTNESILRSFCRAVGPQTSVAHIGAEVVSAFLDGGGPVTSGWFTKYQRTEGVLPLRGQSRASH